MLTLRASIIYFSLGHPWRLLGIDIEKRSIFSKKIQKLFSQVRNFRQMSRLLW